MRSVIIRTALLITTLIFTSSKAGARMCHSVTMSGPPDFPPVVWSDYLEIHGAAKELLEKAFKRHNIDVTTDHLGGYNRVLSHFKKGLIHVIPAMTRNSELAEHTTFIEPAIYQQTYAVVVRRDKENHPQTWDDLTMLRGVAPRGLTFGDDFNQFANNNLQVMLTTRPRQGLKMLEVGRVDYAIYPDIQGDLFVSLLDLEGKFEKTPIDIATFNLYAGVSNALDCDIPLEDISSTIQALIKSGEAATIFNDSLYKWMGYSLDQKGMTYSPIE